MNKERFKDYDDEVRELVLAFERMQREGRNQYFDTSEMEIIIDYYLECNDERGVAQSVRYGKELFPESMSMWLREAHHLCMQEKYDEALHLLKKIERRDPDYCDMLYALGAVYSVKEEPKRAIAYYLRSAADGYDLGTIYANVADEYVKLERYSDAQRYYLRALKEGGEEERLLFGLAMMFDNSDRLDEGIHFFRDYVQEHAYSYVAWYCLAEMQRLVGLVEKAVDSFLFCLTIKPDYEQASLSLSESYCELNEYSKAVQTLHDACSHTTDLAGMYLRIACIFMTQNNYETALTYLYKGVKMNTRMPELWQWIALAHMGLGQNIEALEAARKALAIEPESAPMLDTTAHIYLNMGLNDEAEKCFLMATELDEGTADTAVHYADYLMGQERWEEAIEILERGLDRSHNPLDLHMRMAACYFAQGQRNRLFNSVRDCIYDQPNGGDELLAAYPWMMNDIDIMNIITTMKREGEPYDNEDYNIDHKLY
ncbi:MAG: tetratricopeptide repeat protein [Bacteroidales bacterium]|nr:tetratricopeptide repeat protein [Bacteroidales bacterium]